MLRKVKRINYYEPSSGPPSLVKIYRGVDVVEKTAVLEHANKTKQNTFSCDSWLISLIMIPWYTCWAG